MRADLGELLDQVREKLRRAPVVVDLLPDRLLRLPVEVLDLRVRLRRKSRVVDELQERLERLHLQGVLAVLVVAEDADLPETRPPLDQHLLAGLGAVVRADLVLVVLDAVPQLFLRVDIHS